MKTTQVERATNEQKEKTLYFSSLMELTLVFWTIQKILIFHWVPQIMTLLEREDKEKPELHCSPEVGCNPMLHLCSLQTSLSITVLHLSLIALVSQQPLKLSLGLNRLCVLCYRSTPPVLDSSCNFVTSKVT